MNMSHMLPIYQSVHILYDSALPRICKYLENKNNKIFIVDMGANIGDTVAMIQSEISDYSKILCVEGSESFYISEKQAIAELLNSKKKNTLHGYKND
jgi:hypothetical protein